ncbi:uncharacterized protein BYT42DRAFT_617730 [Radiomyces spectabilis]|uniref:uncharacterized protein n=1 Tax=Radiomyces spectabilis TaxID=64574 RepID=UPI0022210DA5|nr:uncharacterized protein BYT42DRAFT_617730 [Radiomyces spectabilis]KAI8368178.1 hypothetical protein BYT42DRAFT_617730 [Radiomyces spectabilis]
MASHLDKALDEVIKENREDRRRTTRPNQRPISTPSGGIRKRSGGPIRTNRMFRSAIRTVEDRGNRSSVTTRRDVNQQWAHDLFEDNQDRSITARLGGHRGAGDRNRGAGAEITIENLHYNVTEDDLKDLFAMVGPVEKTRIIFDRSGRSTGVARISFTSQRDAERAIKKYDTVELDGQAMKIQMSPERERERERRPFRSGDRQPMRGSTGRRDRRPEGGRGRGRLGTRGPARSAKSATDLDNEMDAYMKSNNTVNEDVEMALD